jgi:hypothetical protein
MDAGAVATLSGANNALRRRPLGTDTMYATPHTPLGNFNSGRQPRRTHSNGMKQNRCRSTRSNSLQIVDRKSRLTGHRRRQTAVIEKERTQVA